MDSQYRPESFILTFFTTADDEVHCRIVDSCTKDHWIATNPSELRLLLKPRSVTNWGVRRLAL